MGEKYEIVYMRNGCCLLKNSKLTNSLVVALWYLLRLSIKYPIVTLNIRRGYISCAECDADYCAMASKAEV